MAKGADMIAPEIVEGEGSEEAVVMEEITTKECEARVVWPKERKPQVDDPPSDTREEPEKGVTQSASGH